MALLELEGARKAYPGVRALQGVDLGVERGEVHALLGENGAGKSTLMKVVAGSVTPDAGYMTVDGNPVRLGSLEAAKASGVALVYQDLSLVPQLTVGENVLLGRWPTTRWGTVAWEELHATARRHLGRIGLEVAGRPVRIASPADAIALGIGYLGEDRAAGIVPRMTLAENITLASLPRLGRGWLLATGQERQLARRFADELGIRAPLDRPAATLSGGNQQKLVLARWLCSSALVLVLDDPTRGIDVGAKEEVFRLVRRLAGDGAAILYLTSETREAQTLADRVLVMAGGRIVRTVDPDVPEEEMMAAAGGVHG